MQYSTTLLANSRENSGLGALLSTTFASHGANIAINYFNRAGPAEEVAAACKAHGVKAIIIKADMTSTADAKRAVREALQGLGGLDIILANAVSFSFAGRDRRWRSGDADSKYRVGRALVSGKI
jgi:NAD(P)-dependent dehydrogenase (short-subunit alcohol dehydrogenase family)